MKITKYFKACLMSMTMFCAFPMPFHKWDDESRPLMTACLPIVGLEIGLGWLALAFLLSKLASATILPLSLVAAFLAFYPYLASGFMHLDGFMDVVDATKSYRDLSERRKILKDSKVGAFAVIAVAILLIMSYASAHSIRYGSLEGIAVFALIPVMSRCCSALAVSILPTMETSQFSGEYHMGVKRGQIIFMLFMAVATAVAGVLLCEVYVLALVAVLIGYLLALVKAFRNLEGMNGDIAGYSLTVAELCGLATYAIINNFWG